MTARRMLGSGPAAPPVSPLSAVPARLLPVERAAVDVDQEDSAAPASLRPGAGQERRQRASVPRSARW
ncbi:hypothetical protein NFX46_20800 [Streptomyces phaeoluteigriseus]|uniref:Uncharacterized protein n=1 Tax=Streptomyces phaeoluteigriseus TaxID=114686 RepID=A0ABY4ZAG4_9ACTN|nr:hypothetical protein [Streptomyces phaeoluteigriseus]USQ85945.1 hypothetical protein NFX46_20800 [Streptomyces phaeoluteigriseus]